MRLISVIKIVSVVGVAAVAGLTVGSTVGAAARSHSEAGVSATADGKPAPVIAPDYPTNESGQTYGRIDQGVWPEHEPDLILVAAGNGREGYVAKATLDEITGANVSTLEEAIAWQEQSDTRADRVLIPVFENDGSTFLGSFEITKTIGEQLVAPDTED